ncbi:acyl-CoA N-acyltransferase [Mrakia frigida]|uniref:GNAT family N-acetyltransferase n=1 Tax=Mrakia frigida TaxID=29902 RepID=UPI003FCC24B0
MSFSIRPATEEDIPAILGLIMELAVYEKSAELALATPEDLKKNMFGEGERYARCVVAELDGEKKEVIGMGLYFFNFSTWTGKPGLYLEDLYVQPAHRSLGVGKAVFRELGKIALEKGCARMDWSVLDWNEPAIRFYEDKVHASIMPEWQSVRLSGTKALEGLADLE